MFLHDAVGQGQAQPGAFADWLGGDEGVEDALQVFFRVAIFPLVKSFESVEISVALSAIGVYSCVCGIC